MSGQYPQTFLQLAQRTRQEAGGSGTGPVSVSNQVGESLRFVDWVRAGWVLVQQSEPRWDFLWCQASFDTSEGVFLYDLQPDDGVLIRELDRNTFTSVNKTAGGTKKDRVIEQDYHRFDYMHNRSTRQTGTPTRFAIRPDRKLELAMLPPADVYEIEYNFWRRPQFLVENTDEPIIPIEHRMIIVWAALIAYANYEEDTVLRETAQAEYNRSLADLTTDQISRPTVVMRPLA